MKTACKNLVTNRHKAAHGFANHFNSGYNDEATEEAHKNISFLGNVLSNT